MRCPSAPDYGEGLVDHLSIISEGCLYEGFPANPADSYIYFGYVFDQGEWEDEAVEFMGHEVPVQLMQGLTKLFLAESLWPYMASGEQSGLPSDCANALRTLDSNIPVETPYGNGGNDVIYRLAEGVERVLITDVSDPAASSEAQSDIAVYWDMVNTDPMGGGASMNHVPGGANVLYMDGHVEFHKYDQKGEFPINGRLAEPMAILAEF